MHASSQERVGGGTGIIPHGARTSPWQKDRGCGTESEDVEHQRILGLIHI